MGLFGLGKSDYEKISDLIDKGLELMANEKYQKAYDCFNKAIKIDPKYSGAWHNKGWASLVLENHEEAITCYDEAICLGISQHEQNHRNPFPNWETWKNMKNLLHVLIKYLKIILIMTWRIIC